MSRQFLCRAAELMLCLFLLAGLVAADDAADGTNYKVTFFDQGEPRTLWLITLEPAGDRWTGRVAATAERVPETKVENLRVRDGRLQFMLQLGEQAFAFEGQAPEKDDRALKGTLTIGRQVVPAQLEPTRLTSLDDYAVSKEILEKQADDPRVFSAALAVLGQAEEKKAKPEEVRSWAEKAYKAAEPYGPRWQREMAVRVAEVLLRQQGFAADALAYVRRAERALEPKDPAATHRRVLTTLAAALLKAGKEEEAKEVEARLKKYPLVAVTPFAGRKAEGGRTVLVELFTGAQCPPCIAADLAFDALGQTFKPSEVALLQYHEHIPGPDPMTSPDSEARLEFYGVEGTPSAFANGRPISPGGGGEEAAQEKYDEYRSAVLKLLDEPAKVKVEASATRKGSKIEIRAEASGLEKGGENARLRLALTEEEVSYTGGNRLPTHHHVVRTFPGGVKGVPLKGGSATQTVTVDVNEVRKELEAYLDRFAKENAPFTWKEKPLALKDLRVVAFVQDDRTRQVLGAVSVDVAGEKGGESE